MSVNTAPHSQSNDRKLWLDQSKPRWIQVVTCSAQVVGLLGGLVLALVSMFAYPMLLTGWGYAITYLGPVAVGFVAAFFITPRSWYPATMSVPTRVQLRLGLGLCMSAWFVGAFGIANGYATAVADQDVPMVYRRTSTPSDPRQMSFYIGARVWPSSRDVYEIIVPRTLYETLSVPVVTQWHVPTRQLYLMPSHGLLRLSVGKGRFGINWLHGVVGPEAELD